MATADKLRERAQARIDASARGLREQLRQWMFRFARSEAERYTRELQERGRIAIAKAKPPKPEAIEDELRQILVQFGLRRYTQSARQAGKIVKAMGGPTPDVIIPESLINEFVRQHEPKIQKIVEETREATRKSVGDIMRAAMTADKRPSVGAIAQQIRWQFHGKAGAGGQVVQSVPVIGRGILPTDKMTVDVTHGKEEGILYAFSTERAAFIAETEMAIADSAGTNAGYKALGIEWVEWIAVTSDRRSAGRKHWEMDGKAVRVGDYFTLPDGTKLRYPHDVNGIGDVIGNIARCRCSSRPRRNPPS